MKTFHRYDNETDTAVKMRKLREKKLFLFCVLIKIDSLLCGVEREIFFAQMCAGVGNI